MTQQGDNQIGGFDESLLNAYIDGELDHGQMKRIKHELNDDKEAAQYVRAVRRFHLVSGAALDEEINSSAPGDLEAKLYALKENHAQQSPPPPEENVKQGYRYLHLALAAGFATLALGFTLGFFSSGYHMQQQMLLAQSVREEMLFESKQVMNRVFEHNPSGEVVAWVSDNGKIQGELLPIRTLKLGDKRFCREFQEILIIDGQKEVRQGLSCRQGREQWDTKMIMADPAKRLL
ncbi:MAG: hypothetical protein ABW148_05445 [Sedimenticola sp.]